MSRFDEEPDADPHGECAAEIHRLQAQVEALTAERDAYKADATRYKELMRIAYSDSPQKHLIEVTMDQSKLDAAIAKGTA